MKFDIKEIKQIVLTSPDGQEAFIKVLLRNNSQYIFKSTDYLNFYSSVLELKEELRRYVNITRFGYLYSETAASNILQIIDSDNDVDTFSAQLYLQDKISLDNIYSKRSNKNFLVERLTAVTNKGMLNNPPSIYFNIATPNKGKVGKF